MRPDDVFCKPAYASRKPVTALLLKVKVKKKSSEVLSYEVVGNISEEYRFTGLCDFQYLPTSRDECLYDKIVPRGLDTEWLKGESPYFLPPAAFSRVDTVQVCFRKSQSWNSNICITYFVLYCRISISLKYLQKKLAQM